VIQMDLVVIAIIALLSILGMAALQWGVDTRPLNVDPRYPSRDGLS